MHVVGVVCSVVVGMVFLLAGVGKLARPDQWRTESGGLGVPTLLTTVVPFFEVLLGSLLLVQVARRELAWVAVAVFAMFTVLLIVRLVQGRREPCACFGSLSQSPIGIGHVVRNLVFVSLSVLAAVL
jgi:uncharacterized membrane protein YphA (DoxX/SURF4 family)